MRFLILPLLTIISSFAFAAPDCIKVSEVCVDGPSTKNISGFSVSRNCWKFEAKYQCFNGTTQSDCQELRDQGCAQIGSACVDEFSPDGQCTLFERKFQCSKTPARQETISDCSVKTFCADGACYDTGSSPDPDFVKAAIAVEAAREAGTYQTEDFRLFSGAGESCTKGYGGLKNCCKGSPGAKSNNQIMGQTTGAVFTAAANQGKALINTGSRYVYDFMYPDNAAQIAAAIRSGAFSANRGEFGELFSPTEFQSAGVSFYGFTYGGANAPLASGAWSTGGSGTLGGEVLGLGNGFTFDPTSFAIAVAIQVVQQLMACNPKEQLLGQHKGANLCSYVGSRCSKKILKQCLETTESYCCFNSRLAKLINEQGRAQIGKGWGSAGSPDCSGFTAAEFERLDFSKLDMSEFVQEIMASITPPSADALNQKTAISVQEKARSLQPAGP